MQELRRPVRYVLAGSLLSLVLCPLLVYPAGLGLVGSAVANVAGQAVTAAPVRARARSARTPPGAHARPPSARSWSSAATCCCAPRCSSSSFLAAAGVAARAGTAPLGAHQIALQLFLFLALVLDAYAIAAQTLVGHALGGDRRTRPVPRPGRVALWGLGTGLRDRGSCCSRLRDVLLPLFTDDPAVLAQAEVVWWFLAGMQPLAGLVFALDGVLIGRRRRRLPPHADHRLGASLGFLPLSLLAAAARLGPGRRLDGAHPVHRAPAGRHGASGWRGRGG